MSRFLLAAGAAVVSALTCAEPQQPADSHATTCPVRSWTTPQLLGTVARFPSIAIGRTGSYVVGNGIALFDAAPVPTSPLTAWKLGVGDVGKPSGTFDYVMPRAVLEESGTLHLLWAEPAQIGAPVAAFEWPPVPLTTLWSATLDPSGHWSVPERVYAGSAISWQSASALAGNDSTGIVVTSARSLAGNPVIVLARLKGSAWAVQEIPSADNAGGANYPTIATRRGVLYLSYTAAAADAGHDVNSVFVRRSEDGGHSWGDAILVSRSGDHPAFEPRLTAGPGGALDLVWFQTMTNDLTVVRHVRSVDGAATWSRPTDLGAAAEHHGLRSASESCGSLHVVYEEWTQDFDKRRLVYVSRESRWSAPRALFDTVVSLDADLAMDRAGAPLLIFHRPVDQSATSPITAFLSGLK